MTGHEILVPVGESTTLRNTVGHVVRGAVDAQEAVTLHFVYPLRSRGRSGSEAETAAELLDRIEVWVGEDLEGIEAAIGVETATVGEDEYLFSPGDYADSIAAYATEHDIESIVVDPGYRPAGTTPLLPALNWELSESGLDVEEAPVERESRRSRLVRRSGLDQFVLLFGLSASFYLFLAGSLTPYNLLSGAVTSAAVAATLWHVSLTGSVRPRRLAVQFGRLCLYAPFLLWEIAKANLQVAYVVLHPSLPIDPKVVEFDADVWSTVPAATLANSITLTPGTLTVDVESRHFTIHSLTADAREELAGGTLERAVRFVFYGRSAARRPTVAEREEVEE
ncbi:monovalent cation/H+ antiporter subunit E [Halobaculum sp. CBA1158]|uniref:monovalent cation/H+ antiporter subunit E n=1 Tax=Halobaculum sp. CBA1158 TaxID=2904243 RepID=UPI001F17BF7C|nr:monovalent cation/H+ antiporter subunit E [Halobaculum sp. CBA1158]UIO98470.1 monovalent cation/H+ antiporter subunit E [Halobaculum sp. CBA1158]